MEASPTIPEEAFAQILEELERRPLQTNKYRNIAGAGKTQAFGVVGRRCLPPDYSRQCWGRPRLYQLLLEFGDRWVRPAGVDFTSVTVNCNYAAAPHRDKNNNGRSFLVGFGNYQGGYTALLEGELKGDYDIRFRPLILDFSSVLHCVKEGWTGDRYSLVFYRYSNPKWPSTPLPPPSVKEIETGKLCFFRGEEVCFGLPHPLRGRKKVKAQVETPVKEGGFIVTFD
jgi:hypothetical protein